MADIKFWEEMNQAPFVNGDDKLMIGKPNGATQYADVNQLNAILANGRGITDISLSSSDGLVDTYTITYTDDTTSTFEVTNGQDGENAYFNFKGSVTSYANLPASGNVQNDAWYNLDDGLLYVYSGTAYPDEGEGISFGGGGEPTGPAGGDLSGSYPNPQIADGLSINRPILLNNTNDLDDVIAPGYYWHSQGNLPSNTPIARAGMVRVTRSGPSSIYIQQEWTGRDDSVKYIRNTDSNEQFLAWRKILTNVDALPSTPVRNTSGSTITIASGDEGGIVNWSGSLDGLSINASEVLNMPIGTQVKVFVAPTELNDGNVLVSATGSDVIGSEATLRENAESGMITIMRFLAGDTIYVSWDGSWEFNEEN